MVTATPPVAPLELFTGSLATRHNPSFLSALGHSVDSQGPGGFVEGLLSLGLPQPSASGGGLVVRAKPAESAPIQRLVLPVSPEPVQRLATNNAAQFSADLIHAPAPDPERVLPVVDEPAATEAVSSVSDVPAEDAALIGTSRQSEPSSPETPADQVAPTPTVDLPLVTTAPTVSRLVSGRTPDSGLAAPLETPAAQTSQATSATHTAPTIGLSALLPISPPSTPVFTPPSSSASTAAIPRRGLGVPLLTTPVQRHPDTAAGPAALLGLENVLRTSVSDPTASTTPDPGASLLLAPSIQRSTDSTTSTEHNAAVDEHTHHSEHAEQVETNLAEPDAPLIGGSGLSETSIPDDVAATTSQSATAELPVALSTASSPAARTPVPLQRYAGDSVSVLEPQVIQRLATRPLIGDRAPLAAATAPRDADSVQRAVNDVDPVVAVRYDAKSTGHARTSTPASPRVQQTTAGDGSTGEQSVIHRAATSSQGASLQRFADPVAAHGSSVPPSLSNGSDQPASAHRSPHPTGPPSAALLLQRFGDPGQAAVAAGVATPDGQGSVVFNSPYQPPTAPSHAPEVQRAVELKEMTAAVSTPVEAPAAAAMPDIDELAQRLFDPLSARLKTELWMDRERAGFVTDLRR